MSIMKIINYLKQCTPWIPLHWMLAAAQRLDIPAVPALAGTLWWHLLGQGRSLSCDVVKGGTHHPYGFRLQQRPDIITTISSFFHLKGQRKITCKSGPSADDQHALTVPENGFLTSYQKNLISKYLWHRWTQQSMKLNSQRFFFNCFVYPSSGGSE